jgi:GDP-4-dehydro-6-deoxy-D-mannose reductase
MQALITGISGFVGSHLAEYLLAHTDWQVAGTVYGRPDNIAHLRDRLTLYQAELSRLEVVRYVIEEVQPDYVFHLAAQPISALSRQDPWFTLENNIRAQVNILEVVAQARLACRVLVVGSSEEYGQVAHEDLPVDEDTPLRPSTAYAVSKIAQDYLGLQYYLSHGVAAVRVRPFNHIGPRQRLGFVAADLAYQIARIEASRPDRFARTTSDNSAAAQVMVGALDVARDFSDVRDVVRGYYLALTQGEPGEVYNLGSGCARTVRELLETLIRLSSWEIEIVQDPQRMRPVDVPIVVADAAKLQRRTGWRADIPFERSLSDVLTYWRNQVRTGATDPTPLEMRSPVLGSSADGRPAT